MSGREAARRAAFHAAAVIESALANGWETLDRYGADRPRVQAALNELRAELDRRARPRPGGRRDETTENVTETAALPLDSTGLGMAAAPRRDEKRESVTEPAAAAEPRA
jgi:hypothetical protein